MAASAILLDLTRLVSRLGKGALTGIDRVERAYLSELLDCDLPVFGLVRTPVGLLLLERPALKMVLGWAKGGALPSRRDWIGRIGRPGDPLRAGIETELRAGAVARLPVALCGRRLGRMLPPGAVYLNLGHANLSSRLLAQLRGVAGLRVGILLHDTIPLDFPQFARPDQGAAFAEKLASISAHADLVIHTAQSTRRRNEVHLARSGRVPPGVVAHLAVDLVAPDRMAVPKDLTLPPRYFVALGTVEPRKNHTLLLDVWEQLARRGGDLPGLLILGNRGWSSTAVLERIDRGVAGVQMRSGLPDAAVASLLSGARGLLFPSFAEGFGLPALEAAGRGTAVILSDLPIFRELLGDGATYLDPADISSWVETIAAIESGRLDLRQSDIDAGMRRMAATWAAHVRTVLTSF